MTGMDRMRRPWAWLGVGLLAAAAMAIPVCARAQARPPRPDGAAARERPLIEAAPIRCWWRTSTGAVMIGEPFEVRLTCAMIETASSGPTVRAIATV